MKKSYTHLTQEERYQIYAYMKAGYCNGDIAEMLGRNVSTIKREQRRNTGQKGYRPQQAHSFAQERHQMKPKAIKLTEDMQQHIREQLEQQWSPEQIQGRLEADGEPSVCPKTIYDFIARDKAQGGAEYGRYRVTNGAVENEGYCRTTSLVAFLLVFSFTIARADILSKVDAAVANILFDVNDLDPFTSYRVDDNGLENMVFASKISDKFMQCC